jgi:hypothetical protein
MAVLRVPGDTGINQGMGALGQALGMMFDPRLRWEAYELQQRIAMQRLQMQELQRKFGARDDLKAAYMHDPNIRAWMDNDPSAPAKVRYAIENGISLNDLIKMQGVETLAHGGGQNPIGAATEALGAPYDKTYMPITSASTAAAAATAQATQEAAKNAEIERGKLLGGATKLAPGERLVGPGVSTAGIAPLTITTDPNTLQPSIGLGGTTASSGASKTPSASDTPPVSPAAQAAPASAGAGAQMNSGQAGSSTVGGAMVTGNTPGSSPVQPGQQLPIGTITGADPVQIEARKNQVGFTQKDAQADYNKQDAINQAEGIIRDIRALETLNQTGGYTGQVQAQWRQYLHDHWGLAIGDTATAQQAEASLLVDTLAQVRQRMGLSTVRVGEIDPIVKPTLGSATMPPGALNTILAQEQSGLEVDKRNVINAYAYMTGSYGEAGSGDAENTYLKNKKTNEDSYGAIRAKNNEEFGSIVSQAQRTPATATSSPATWGGFFPAPPAVGAPAPAAPAPTAPAPTAPAPPVIAGPAAAAAPVPAQAPPSPENPDFVFSGGKVVPASPPAQ